MMSCIGSGIVIGLALGSFADYIRLKHGWKPALVLSVAYIACVLAVTVQTDLSSTVEGALLVTYGMSSFLAEPLLKKLVHRAPPR